jgi:hypothetical protein
MHDVHSDLILYRHTAAERERAERHSAVWCGAGCGTAHTTKHSIAQHWVLRDAWVCAGVHVRKSKCCSGNRNAAVCCAEAPPPTHTLTGDRRLVGRQRDATALLCSSTLTYRAQRISLYGTVCDMRWCAQHSQAVGGRCGCSYAGLCHALLCCAESSMLESIINRDFVPWTA